MPDEKSSGFTFTATFKHIIAMIISYFRTTLVALLKTRLPKWNTLVSTCLFNFTKFPKNKIIQTFLELTEAQSLARGHQLF